MTERRNALPAWELAEGGPMPIRPFLNGEQFDQETLRILGVAFEQVGIACGPEIVTTTSGKR